MNMEQQTKVDLPIKIDIYNHLYCALDDIACGRVQPLSEAMDEIRTALCDLELCKYLK